MTELFWPKKAERNELMEIKKFYFTIHGDNRGKLVAVENLKDIPFEVKRVYYMWDTTESVVRGKHAHKKLEQVLICLHGSCKILLDDGKEKAVVELNNPSEGLHIKGPIWREMSDFSNDAVLMVLASEYYTEDDYIRNYDDFIKYIENGD